MMTAIVTPGSRSTERTTTQQLQTQTFSPYRNFPPVVVPPRDCNSNTRVVVLRKDHDPATANFNILSLSEFSAGCSPFKGTATVDTANLRDDHDCNTRVAVLRKDHYPAAANSNILSLSEFPAGRSPSKGTATVNTANLRDDCDCNTRVAVLRKDHDPAAANFNILSLSEFSAGCSPFKGTATVNSIPLLIPEYFLNFESLYVFNCSNS